MNGLKMQLERYWYLFSSSSWKRIWMAWWTIEYFKPCLTIVSDGKYLDTSITNKYAEINTGWEVYSRSSEW